MRKVLRDNLVFLIPFLIFLALSSIYLFFYSKGEIHLYLNGFRHSFLDSFFPYATWFGDFLGVIGASVVLCFVKYRYAALVIGANICSAMFTQFLKHTLFSDIVRPVKFFESVQQLVLVPGYENYMYNSFPSGHTTSAFTTFFCLALIISNRVLKFIMFVAAITVGASRIYLSQHFLNDVYAGSIIGVSISLVVYHYFFISEKSLNRSWLDKSIIK